MLAICLLFSPNIIFTADFMHFDKIWTLLNKREGRRVSAFAANMTDVCMRPRYV